MAAGGEKHFMPIMMQTVRPWNNGMSINCLYQGFSTLNLWASAVPSGLWGSSWICGDPCWLWPFMLNWAHRAQAWHMGAGQESCGDPGARSQVGRRGTRPLELGPSQVEVVQGPRSQIPV